MARLSPAVLLLTLGFVATLTLSGLDGVVSYATPRRAHRKALRLLAGSPIPSSVWTTLDSVLSTSTGPTDFAAIGDAVGIVSELFQVHEALAVDVTAATESSKLVEQLKAAVLHLFPFLSAQDQHSVSHVQQFNSSTKGIVVTCFNKDFQFALHLVAASKFTTLADTS